MKATLSNGIVLKGTPEEIAKVIELTSKQNTYTITYYPAYPATEWYKKIPNAMDATTTVGPMKYETWNVSYQPGVGA